MASNIDETLDSDSENSDSDSTVSYNLTSDDSDCSEGELEFEFEASAWEKVEDRDADDIPSTLPFNPEGVPGPKNCPPSDSTAEKYFLSLFGDDFMDLFIAETNRYGDQKYLPKQQQREQRNNNRRKKKSYLAWYHVSKEEMLAFLGVVINMGLIKKRCLKEYWNTKDKSQSTPWFSEIFRRDRFLMIHRALHFPQLEGDDESKLAKVRGLVVHFSKQFRHFLNPKREVSIDESLIGFEGRGPAIQYLPNKHHHRFGFKLFCLCESATGYTLRFAIYQGKQETVGSNLGVGFDVCRGLMEPYLEQGFHLYTDNWYTSLPLACYLYERKTNVTGTVDRKRKYFPPEVKAKMPKGDSVAYRHHNYITIGWHDKKQIVLLSTEGSSRMIKYTSKRNREHEIPEFVRDYNSHMGGVDLSDMRIYMFLDERRTIRWNKKVFLTLLGRVLLNAFILYQQNTCNAPVMVRRPFIVKCVQGLVGDFRDVRKAAGRPRADNPDRLLNPHKHMNAKRLPVGAKRNCEVCSTPEKRVRTCTTCDGCNGIGLCVGDCWEAYHTKKVYK